MTQPTEHWIAVLEKAGVPCAPIQNYEQVFHDPALLDRDYLWDAPHPRLGRVRQLGSPMRFCLTPTERRRAGPLFGEDSAALLEELGYSPDAIADLFARQVVKGPEHWKGGR